MSSTDKPTTPNLRAVMTIAPPPARLRCGTAKCSVR